MNNIGNMDANLGAFQLLWNMQQIIQSKVVNSQPRLILNKTNKVQFSWIEAVWPFSIQLPKLAQTGNDNTTSNTKKPKFVIQ